MLPSVVVWRGPTKSTPNSAVTGIGWRVPETLWREGFFSLTRIACLDEIFDVLHQFLPLEACLQRRCRLSNTEMAVYAVHHVTLLDYISLLLCAVYFLSGRLIYRIYASREVVQRIVLNHKLLGCFPYGVLVVVTRAICVILSGKTTPNCDTITILWNDTITILWIDTITILWIDTITILWNDTITILRILR